MSWEVYILRCSNGSYYIGHTENLKKRVSIHNSGKGASYTAARLPVTLAYHEPANDKSGAMEREKQIKRWSKSKKDALIQGDMEF